MSLAIPLTATLTVEAESLAEALALAPEVIEDLNRYLSEPYTLQLSQNGDGDG